MHSSLWAGLCGVTLLTGALAAPPSGSAIRGEMLYSNHCRECHTAEVHWRHPRVATDWGALKAQVERWQDNAGLNWGREEVEDVARYLNAAIYRFPTVAPPPVPASVPSAGVSHTSGGVGEEERMLLAASAHLFNVRLVFAEQDSGAYLYGVAVRIDTEQGERVLEAESDGPWFFARLPAGRYRLTVTHEGMRQSRRVDVGTQGVRLTFRWR